MTKNADVKKLVGARMARTGELDAAEPSVDEYADIAGMSDEAVQAKTGKTWVQWVEALDAEKAHTLDHAAIARLVQANWPDMGGWWAQTVTVSYERIRGVREKGQSSKGVWTANKSKTFAVPVETLFARFVAAAEGGAWLGHAAALRAVNVAKSLRFTWPDGSEVSAWFTDKGSKSSVAIQHSKLGGDAARHAAKAAWGERLKALADTL